MRRCKKQLPTSKPAKAFKPIKTPVEPPPGSKVFRWVKPNPSARGMRAENKWRTLGRQVQDGLYALLEYTYSGSTWTWVEQDNRLVRVNEQQQMEMYVRDPLARRPWFPASNNNSYQTVYANDTETGKGL